MNRYQLAALQLALLSPPAKRRERWLGSVSKPPRFTPADYTCHRGLSMARLKSPYDSTATETSYCWNMNSRFAGVCATRK
ncbi:MAG: hypothetical protein H7257_12950 [Taibaiella sp.]|nr:hypothetical protein [Taibaiella sp.]